MAEIDFIEAVAKAGISSRTAREAAKVQGWLHTGNYALNWAIGNRFLRGYPLGHVGEIYGDPSTGKSLLIGKAIAEAQKLGGPAVLDDTEGALNPDFLEQALGADAERLVYTESDTVEGHRDYLLSMLDVMGKVATPRTPGIYALDSFALLSTLHEQEKPDKRDMTRAQETKKLFRLAGRRISSLPLVGS